MIFAQATAKLQLADLYVWADLCSIPQRNPGVKSLSIQSLPSYAGASDFFVAIVPEARHADSSEVCSRDTYLKRAWCRAEILSFFVRRGPAHMYFATGDGVLEQMAPDRSSMDSSEGTILPSAESCVEINQCVGCIGDGAADLGRSSGEEPASPRHRAGVASMVWRTTR